MTYSNHTTEPTLSTRLVCSSLYQTIRLIRFLGQLFASPDVCYLNGRDAGTLLRSGDTPGPVR